MIRIVGKGYKYILVQLTDFLGTVDEILISLKSEIGKKQYTKLFGKALKLQKEKIKIRIISIKQSTLSDFFTLLMKNSLTMKTKAYDSGYEVYSACGTKHILQFTEKIKIKKSKNHAISIFQTKFTDFLEDGLDLKKKVRIPTKSNLSCRRVAIIWKEHYQLIKCLPSKITKISKDISVTCLC